MAKRSPKGPKKPTLYQVAILKQIARSRLIKTLLHDRKDPLWQIDGGSEISHQCAQALVRNGWLTANRDGLEMLDNSQTYHALRP